MGRIINLTSLVMVAASVIALISLAVYGIADGGIGRDEKITAGMACASIAAGLVLRAIFPL